MWPRIIVFTLTFFLASSRDADFTKLFSAAFEEEYKDIPLFPFLDDTDEMLKIEFILSK